MILLPLFLGYWDYRLEILGLALAFFSSERVSQSAVQAQPELTIDLTGLELAIFRLCLVSAGNTSKLHHPQRCLILCISSQLAYCLFESPRGWKSSRVVALPSGGHKAISMNFPELLFHCSSGLHPNPSSDTGSRRTNLSIRLLLALCTWCTAAPGIEPSGHRRGEEPLCCYVTTIDALSF